MDVNDDEQHTPSNETHSQRNILFKMSSLEDGSRSFLHSFALVLILFVDTFTFERRTML